MVVKASWIIVIGLPTFVHWSKSPYFFVKLRSGALFARERLARLLLEEKILEPTELCLLSGRISHGSQLAGDFSKKEDKADVAEEFGACVNAWGNVGGEVGGDEKVENPDLWKWLTGQERPPETVNVKPVAVFTTVRSKVMHNLNRLSAPATRAASGQPWLRA
ncbi:hypothetical protein Taro_051190 [Colocasia esculenta]|uniref:Uncharacterized protein n=1 Tax=Colocasia esculenta TaxID=4460 RepID=A0A843XG13_COLES|nr:hypothetical protein [Colocasia esculenta]